MSTLLRIGFFLVAGLFALAAGIGLLWFLAYGVAGPAPEQAQVPALSTPATLGWNPEGDVQIRADDEAGALAALGYAHGRRRAWSVVLWRQAALGRLGAWFGEPALPVDRLARQLGFGERARAAYDALDDEHRALLTAYAAGLDAALRDPSGRLVHEFVLLGIDAEPWEPWHTLALERLFAWLATPPPPPDAFARTDTSVAAFYDADDALRQMLHLHGFENSIAWVARDSSGTQLFQRAVYGASALPFLLEARITLRDSLRVVGASLPGTPFFPAGRAPDHAWAVLLTGSGRLAQTRWDTASVESAYSQLVLDDGGERLFRFQTLAGAPLLSAPPPPRPDSLAAADSVWVVAPGGETSTDLHAWIALLRGEDPSFELLRGDGLWLDRSGEARILGAPLVAVRTPTGPFIGATEWSRYAAALLETQETVADLDVWLDDAYSVWAAQTAPPLVTLLERANFEEGAAREALTYLRNWDFTYDASSIAASIFDTWLALYQDTTYALPQPAPPDSAATLSPLQRQTFLKALARLLDTFGPDLSEWRWERTHAHRLSFPAWSHDSLTAALDLRARARYAPIDLPGRGHPTTLAWGTSPIQHRRPAPAAWEGWVRTDAWETLTVRRRRIETGAPLGRYLASDRLPAPVALPDSASAVRVTTLVPRLP